MTRVPNIANWGVFPSQRIFMLARVVAADSASTVRKKYSVFIYSEAEPHAMYAIYKQTLTMCVLQYSNKRMWYIGILEIQYLFQRYIISSYGRTLCITMRHENVCDAYTVNDVPNRSQNSCSVVLKIVNV